MDEKKDYPIDRFLRDVAQAVARDDRGYLAELRRGLGGTMQDQARFWPRTDSFRTNPGTTWGRRCGRSRKAAKATRRRH